MVVQSQFIEMFRAAPKEHVHLKDIATYSIGLTYKPENVKPSGIPVLRSGNIQEKSLDFGDLVRVDSSIPDTLLLRDGDILMCSRNGSAHLVGKVARIRQLPEPMTYGAFMTVIRSEYMDYLFLFFQSDGFRQQISYGKSSTMNQITQKMLDQITLDLPSKTVIKRLSPLLEQADKSKFDGLKSQFIEMFGGSDYPKQSLGDLCKILAGKTLPLDVENEGGPIAYIKVADMNLPENDRVVTTSTRSVTEETAKISGILPIGATVFPKNGAAALHNKKRITAITTCVDMNTMGVYSISDALDSEFLYAFLVHQDVASLTLTGAIPQIRPKDIAALEIPLPPLERQRGYIGMVGQADKSKYLS